MFGNLQNKPSSLNDLSGYLFDECNIEIRKQSIDERFNSQAVEFVKLQLEKEINTHLDVISLCTLPTPFASIRIKDSTKWNLPDDYSIQYQGHGGCRANSKSMISLQFDYDLLSGGIADLSLTSGTRNDQQDAKEVQDNIQPNELLIRDLGYATITYMKNITAKRAFFLNKMSPQFTVYDAKKEKVDFKAMLRKMQKNNLQQVEQNVLIGSRERFACRMIAIKVPEQVYQSRIASAQKIAKKRGYQLTETYKVRARFNIYLTNAPEGMLPARMVMDVYRIRWQVELMFKVWKSLVNIHTISEMKMKRFEAQLIAKLIWIMVNWKIFFAINHWIRSQDCEKMCSIWKFYKQALRKPSELCNVILKNADFKQWLTHQFEKANRNLLLEKKKNKMAFYEQFNLLFDLA